MRISILYLMLLSFGYNLKAQSMLDSLLYQYEEQIGSEKIKTGINISNYYDNDDLFESLKYAKEALAFANEFGTTDDVLTAYNRIGIVYYKFGDLAKSNEFFLIAIQVSNELEVPNLTNEGRLLNNIANNYGELAQEKLAIAYYKKSLKIKRELNDSIHFSITLNNMALTYSSLHYYDSAKMVLKEALLIDKLQRDDLSLAYTEGSLGEIYLDVGYADSAIYYLDASLIFFKKIPDSDYILAYFHQKLGEANCLSGQFKEAENHFSTALELSIKIGAKPIERDSYKGLQSVNENQGLYKKAFEYNHLFVALQDSLYKSESAQKLTAIETSYQIKNKEQEISILNAEAEIDQFKFYGAAATAFLVMILLGFLYYRYLFKEKANYILQQKNNTIQKQNKEIMDGVEYAKGIQEAILPDFSSMDSLFQSSFIYYKPAQIVSGDFYWVDKVDENILLVLADGTGHGVPGAFLSVLGSSILRQITSENRITKPDEILSALNQKVIEGLGQSKLNSTLKDGMDVGVCSYNTRTGLLTFAGAKRPLILKIKGEVRLIKGNRFSVGGSQNDSPEFNAHYFNMQKGDLLLLFTDGIIDQFGGEEDKKFLTKRLIQLLKDGEGIEGFQSNFEEEMNSWKKGRDQTDDMLLLGVQI